MHTQTHSILGIPGNLTKAAKPCGKLWARQRWMSEPRKLTAAKAKKHHLSPSSQMRVTARFDDDPTNGHNTFAITADVYRGGNFSNDRAFETGGCCHEIIADVFPELAPLIMWHLVNTDSPMHYVANTLYFAGDRDHNGLRKGETRQIRHGKTGELCWRLQSVDYDDRSAQGDNPPPPVTLQWEPVQHVGEGKERDFDAARRAACWPNATDAQLSLPRDELKALLEARTPQLAADFKTAMVSAGFDWEPS